MHGFTLVELLVVIAIIALLMGILMPFVSIAIKRTANVRTSARVAELAGGCNMYHTENGYYPGQINPLELKGSGGNFTGSQWLAKSLFTDSEGNFLRPQYAPLKATEDLIDYKVGTVTYNNTIWDRNKTDEEFRPILYYPARLGVSGLNQYKSADNPINSGHAGSTTFDIFKKDTRFGSGTTPYAPGAFLIIAAGKDRLYFTKDDICYPAFSGD